MSGSGKKGKTTSPGKAGVNPAKPDRSKPWPGKDAPFNVDTSDDGDFATPKRDFDEDEVKEREDRRS